MRRLVGRLGGEHGQMLVVAALLTTVLLGFIGLVADLGLFYAERRQTQNAADEAAKAAAHELHYGGSVAQAQTAALQNAAANGFNNNGTSNAVTVRIPPTSGEHTGDINYAEVLVTEEPPTFFIHVLLSAGNVGGRGVAGVLEALDYAIYVGPDCDGNPDMDGEGEIEGNSILIEGSVFAADLEIEGDNAEVTGAVQWLCELDMDVGNRTFGSGPTQLASPPPVPVNISYSDFTCTFSVTGNMEIDDSTPQYWANNNPATGMLKPGVYCATGEIEIHGPDPNRTVSGNVTFVSHDEIELHSDVNGFNLIAFQAGVLAFTDGTEDGDDEGEIELEADNGTWAGMLIAPHGEIELEGDNLVSTATLIYAGEEAEIEGDNIDLTAMNLSNLDNVALVE